MIFFRCNSNRKQGLLIVRGEVSHGFEQLQNFAKPSQSLKRRRYNKKRNQGKVNFQLTYQEEEYFDLFLKHV